MRFVVTGGAGFIGSHLVARLVADGHEVVVLDDLSSGTPQNLDAVAGRIRLIEDTITSTAACRAAVDGADFVLHHAALVSVPESMANPRRAHDVNVGGTYNVLEAAREAGVRRVVLAGTSAYYGNDPVLPKTEEMLAAPASPYAATKASAELYAAMFTEAFGLETATLRYFNVFGPRQNPNSAYAAVIPKFITAALRGESPTIFGDGGQTRDFVHVSDVVAANLLACSTPAASGRAFNIGSGVPTSLNDLWRRIAELTGTAAEPVHAAERPGDVRDSVCSPERARRIMGFAPATSFDEALRGTIEAYRLHLVPGPAGDNVHGTRSTASALT